MTSTYLQRPDVNRHGLGRYMKAAVRRAVRQRCGFGCVVCAQAFYHYDHLHSQFKDAELHDPTKITLLCPNHHHMRHDKSLSFAQVVAHDANPKAHQQSFAGRPLYPLAGHPRFWLGNVHFSGTPVVLKHDNRSLVAFSPPEAAGGPPVLNATFEGEGGRVIAQVIDNEWRVETSNWDVQFSGSVTTIRSTKLYDVTLRWNHACRGSDLGIESMKLRSGDAALNVARGGSLEIALATGHTMRVESGIIVDASVGVEILEKGFSVGRDARRITYTEASFTSPRLIGPAVRFKAVGFQGLGAMLDSLHRSPDMNVHYDTVFIEGP